MNTTTVRNIAITIAATAITAAQVYSTHLERRRHIQMARNDRQWALDRAADQRRAQQSHDAHMRFWQDRPLTPHDPAPTS